MIVSFVSASLVAAGLYLAIGLVVSLAVQLRGLRFIDPATENGATFGFRLLITPGIVALWPLVLHRWRFAQADRQVAGAELRRLHRRLAMVMLVVVPTLAGAALVTRQDADNTNPSARQLLPETPPAAEVITRWQTPFADLNIDVTLRAEPTGALQLELEVDEDLEIPGLMAYWVAPSTNSATTVLGAVWGPGTRRLALPSAAAEGGIVRLYSLGWRKTVGEHPLPALDTR